MVLIPDFAFGDHKIPSGAQHARVRFNASAGNRLQVIDLQLDRGDFRSPWDDTVGSDGRRGVGQRRKNSSVDHSMDLLMVRPHIQQKNRVPLLHFFHIEAEMRYHPAFFHALAH
jgi:hypothetical protein